MPHLHLPRSLGPQGPSPVSAVVDTGALVFVSGQVPSVPGGQEPPREIADQTRLVLGKIRGLLQEAGLGLEHVAKVTAFLADPSLLGAVNEVYREFFPPPYPSRSAVGAVLPKPGFLVEIEALAVRPSQPED